MAAAKPLKVSYCTTCHKRLDDLRLTLEANMRVAEKDTPNEQVEFVVLDYGSVDRLEDKIERPEDNTRMRDWIMKTFPEEIKSGRLRYARFETPNFEMAHAKNMAHRLATGDILCNVDADNFIAPKFSYWLNDHFSKEPNSIVTRHSATLKEEVRDQARMLYKGIRKGKIGSLGGTAGRLALMRKDFEALHGYDETYAAWGGDEANLVVRARDMGLTKTLLPKAQVGRDIEHGDEARYKNMSPENQKKSLENLNRKLIGRVAKKYELLNQSYNPVANPDGNVGCGLVHVNFSRQPELIDRLTVPDAMPGIQEVVTSAQPTTRSDWAVLHGRRSEIGPKHR